MNTQITMLRNTPLEGYDNYREVLAESEHDLRGTVFMQKRGYKSGDITGRRSMVFNLAGSIRLGSDIYIS